jgi:hypothetical protein
MAVQPPRDEAYQRAWEAGLAMSVDEAVAAALAD